MEGWFTGWCTRQEAKRIAFVLGFTKKPTRVSEHSFTLVKDLLKVVEMRWH